MKHAEAGDEPGIEEELDEAAGDAVHSKDSANLTRAQTETTAKVKRQLGIVGGALADGVVEKDADILVKGDRMEGEEGVGSEVDNCLA